MINAKTAKGKNFARSIKKKQEQNIAKIMNKKVIFTEEEQKAISAIEYVFKVKFEIIQSEKRTKSASLARQTFCHIFYHVFGYTLEAIAEMVNRKHTSVLFSIESYQNDMLYCKAFRGKIEQLKRIYNYR